MKQIPCFLFFIIILSLQGKGQNDNVHPFGKVRNGKVINDSTAAIQKQKQKDAIHRMDSARAVNRLRQADTIHNNFLKLDVTRLLWLEIFATYERKFNRWLSFEAGAGYQFSDGGTFKVTDPGGEAYYMIFPYQGAIVTIGPKFYHFIPRRPNIYWDLLFLYRNLWYDKLFYSGDDYSLEDRNRIDYGASINWGIMKKFEGLIVDFGFGIGIRKTNIKVTVYQSAPYWDHNRITTYDPPEVYYINKINPVLNISLKLGFGL